MSHQPKYYLFTYEEFQDALAMLKQNYGHTPAYPWVKQELTGRPVDNLFAAAGLTESEEAQLRWRRGEDVQVEVWTNSRPFWRPQAKLDLKYVSQFRFKPEEPKFLPDDLAHGLLTCDQEF